MKNCPICKKGPFEQVDDIIFDVEGYIFILEGARCQNCKEEFPHRKKTRGMVGTTETLPPSEQKHRRTRF